jgi:hypothetical protein
VSLVGVQTEDRPVVKERVELIQEHRPVEKEFVVSGGMGLCWLRVAGCVLLLVVLSRHMADSLLCSIPPVQLFTLCLPSLQVETRATGEERQVGAGKVEHLGTTERVVGAAPPKGACD